MSFDPERYLARIGLTAAPRPDAEGLRALVEAQARSIAFENFDVWLGREVSIDPDRIADKLVDRRRGGYCFELNGLLRQALAAFGFDARPLLARVVVRRAPGAPPGPRTHEVALVTIDGRRWIADAGFGGGLPCRPLPLEVGPEHEQLGERLRFVEDDELGWTLQMADVASADGWRDLYGFTLERVYPADVLCANHFTATFPASPFVQGVVASCPDGDGRIILRGAQVFLHQEGQTHVEPAPEGPERLEWLRARFGIDLDVAPDELPPWSLTSP